MIIPGSKQKAIAVDLFYKGSAKAKSVVIFVHGFKGFKDWGHFNLLALKFAEEDFVFIKFNFSYNGTTVEKPNEFADLEAFGNNNYLVELNDLQLVIDWTLKHEPLSKEINLNEIYLIGHSRGGGIGILKAAEDARIKKIVTWASVSDFLNRNKQSTINEWKEKGVVNTFNTRTKQNMPLYYQFYETLQANKERLNILRSAGQLKIPFLIIHGTNDKAVSHNDAKELHNVAIKSELFLIEGAGHTFEAKHPFTENIFPENAALAITKTIEFLKQ